MVGRYRFRPAGISSRALPFSTGVYTDTGRGHEGGIYKAAGWCYLGTTTTHAYRVLGEVVHPRTLHSRYGRGGQSVPWLRANVDPKAERIVTPPKHKYALALDDDARQLLASMAKPYPRSRAGGVAASTGGDQPSRDGASPIPALQSAEAS